MAHVTLMLAVEMIHGVMVWRVRNFMDVMVATVVKVMIHMVNVTKLHRNVRIQHVHLKW